MPKRSHPSSGGDSNPLSSARKGVGGKSGGRDGGATAGRAERKAQSLWHRKSGAGYHLFLSYYGSQPAGVVVADISSDATGLKVGGATAKPNGADRSRGMSRAAKRRRRKKRSGPIEVVETNESDRFGGVAVPRPQMKFNASHPLVGAFESAKKHPHLTGFVRALSRPLPLTLRFREHDNSISSATQLKRVLDSDHSDLVCPVSYDPNQSIYQSTPSSSLCKSNLSKLSPKLKELVVGGSMDGTLARQELGSMLPVIGLRSVGAIKAGSKVLDLCASPGSKTLQALEIVTRKGGGKSGKVVANDVHAGRLDSLCEAVLRAGLPDSMHSRVTYTNYDASVFPAPKSGKLFDAIICDVPCGGDGTIRKDKHILPMWSPSISNAMHSLQLKILSRAMKLIRVGGTVCYSTCSLNPVEDEAVVSAALDGADDDTSFELVDWPPNTLPDFTRRPGVVDWKVAFYDNNDVEDDGDDFGRLSFFDNYESAVSAGEENAESTLWPKRELNESLRIEHCTRLFPQDNDTGGFFLTLIRRIR